MTRAQRNTAICDFPVDAANSRIVVLMTEAQRKFAEVQNIIKSCNDLLKEILLTQQERLKKLTEQEKLTAAEQAEAQSSPMP